jgi:Holliday junction resolvase RusA-like endonuclease
MQKNHNGKLVRIRVKTDDYTKWRRAAVLSIFAQVRADQRIGGKVSVGISLPIKCRKDVDNVIKGILDALVDSRRIDDDRNVMSVSSSKILTSEPAIIVVKAWPV